MNGLMHGHIDTYFGFRREIDIYGHGKRWKQKIEEWTLLVANPTFLTPPHLHHRTISLLPARRLIVPCAHFTHVAAAYTCTHIIHPPINQSFIIPPSCGLAAAALGRPDLTEVAVAAAIQSVNQERPR
eukprot:GHVU01073294.1.p2 GENE.GHVU01073294.1~~GHVU01073294.1.p2  ORF type:complete len:128 (-),score=8.37 GHVU01073294.1:674-1057(-)